MSKYDWLCNDYDRFLSARLVNMLKSMHSKIEVNIDELINEIRAITFASNVNEVMWFYFPLISYILYYYPQYSSKLLHYIVEPLFANGDYDPKLVVETLKRTLLFKEKSVQNYMSEVGKDWVNQLDEKDYAIIQQTINYCWIELDDPTYYEETTGLNWEDLKTVYKH